MSKRNLTGDRLDGRCEIGCDMAGDLTCRRLNVGIHLEPIERAARGELERRLQSDALDSDRTT